MSIICSRYKYVILFGEAKPPGIVTGTCQEFEILSIRTKMIYTLAKFVTLSVYCSFKSGIAHYSPYFVIKSVF